MIWLLEPRIEKNSLSPRKTTWQVQDGSQLLQKYEKGEYAYLKLLPATYLAILWRPFLSVKT